MADHAVTHHLRIGAGPHHLQLVRHGQPNVQVGKRVSRWEIVILAPFVVVAYVVGGMIAGPILGVLEAVDELHRCWRKA